MIGKTSCVICTTGGERHRVVGSVAEIAVRIIEEWTTALVEFSRYADETPLYVNPLEVTGIEAP